MKGKARKETEKKANEEKTQKAAGTCVSAQTTRLTTSKTGSEMWIMFVLNKIICLWIFHETIRTGRTSKQISNDL